MYVCIYPRTRQTDRTAVHSFCLGGCARPTGGGGFWGFYIMKHTLTVPRIAGEPTGTYGGIDWRAMESADPGFFQDRCRAIAAGLTTFNAPCGNCLADQPHCVKTGYCLICAPGLLRKARDGDSPLRAAARRRGLTRYLDRCERCGLVDHWVRTGGCSQCRTIDGRGRQSRAMTTARRIAYDSDATTYLAPCPLHGEVAHHTRRGLCLGCYDTTGKPRDDLYMRFCKMCGETTVFAKRTRCCTFC